jgi:hypothetical protein
MLRLITSIAVFVTLSAPAYGGWNYKENIDPFDDTDTSTVIADPEDYSGTDVLVVAVKCQSDGLNLLLGHSYMSGNTNDQIKIQMRVDKEEPYSKLWSMSASQKNSWMPMTDVRGMVAQMKAGNKLVVRAYDPYDGDTSTQSLSLSGFSKQVEKLSCY